MHGHLYYYGYFQGELHVPFLSPGLWDPRSGSSEALPKARRQPASRAPCLHGDAPNATVLTLAPGRTQAVSKTPSARLQHSWWGDRCFGADTRSAVANLSSPCCLFSAGTAPWGWELPRPFRSPQGPADGPLAGLRVTQGATGSLCPSLGTRTPSCSPVAH